MSARVSLQQRIDDYLAERRRLGSNCTPGIRCWLDLPVTSLPGTTAGH
jgi:hypothetical protein